MKERSLEHFPPEDWVDLARNLEPPAKGAQMRAHLELGCDECREAWKVWRLVLELCSREPGYRPVESAVRVGKAAYPGAKSWRWLKTVAEFAQLRFDSFLQPAPTMVRASGSQTRQLVHRADPYVIDLRLESDPLRGARTFLMGQILNSKHPEENPGDIEVILLSGDRLLGKTATTASGEFQMELTREEDMQLFINIRSERAIGINLPELKD